MIPRLGSQKPPVVTGRFVGPQQYEKMLANLKKKESQLTHAKKGLNDQRHVMTVSRFTPEGYKVAEAKLHALEKKVSTLTKEVKDLKHLMTVA